jgi:cytochrome bd ubiquinol oxidase subunit I
MLLFILFIYLLNEKVKHGPEEGDQADPYHQLHDVVEERAHDTYL